MINFKSVKLFLILTFALVGILGIGVNTALAQTTCKTWGDLEGCLTVNEDGSITATVTTNGGSYDVGVASYLKYQNETLPSLIDQAVYHFALGNVSPEKQAVLHIEKPDCASQVDLFVGDVVYSFTGEGTSYGDRLILALHFVTDPCDPGTGDEGCTPGYWKNHDGYWSEKARSYATIFFRGRYGYNPELNGAVTDEIGSLTLDQALSVKGNKNKYEALLRSSAAALLSASHPEVDYPLLPSGVIPLVWEAWEHWLNGEMDQVEAIKNLLDGYNNLGCELGRYPYP